MNGGEEPYPSPDQPTEAPHKPLKSAYRILANYGPGPPAKEIDENRRDIFRGFGEEF